MAWSSALLFLSILGLLRFSQAWDVRATLSYLQSNLSPGTEFYLPSDSNWDEATRRWTVYERPTYLLSVKPAKESDVQTTVEYADAHDIPFLATGGSHGFSTSYGELQNGMELDLGAFRNIHVDAASKTMTVGGAVRFGEVYDPLYEAGFEVPTGSCSCVNMVGATLGGGISPQQGLYGMILDSLLEVRVVTGTGTIVTASESKNPDLFWGIRGAGFNFGIVLSATYRIYELPNKGQVMNADFVFPANSSRRHWELLRSFEKDQPAGLSLVSTVTYQEQYGGVNIIFNAQYVGSLDEGKALIHPFIENGPIVQNITELPRNKVTASASFGADAALCVKGSRLDFYTAGLKTIDIDTWQAFFSNLSGLYNEYPELRRSAFLAETFPIQGVQNVPDSATSYPHRDVKTQLLFRYDNNDPDLDSTVNDFAKEMRSLFEETSGFDSLRTYISYGHGDEGVGSWYGWRNVWRLILLKGRWDPRNIFRFKNPLIPGHQN